MHRTRATRIDRNVKSEMNDQSLPELLPVYKFVPLIGGISRPTFIKRLAAGVIRPAAFLNGKPVFQRSDADRIREELEKA